MNTRMLVLVVGAVVLIAGVIGLLVPVSANGGGDKSVGCGSALMSDLSEAKAADNNLSNKGADITSQVAPGLAPAIPGQTDYVGACNSALGSRRAWTIPLAVVGLLVAGGSFFVGGRGVRSARA
jgi:hypothetical protein